MKATLAVEGRATMVARWLGLPLICLFVAEPVAAQPSPARSVQQLIDDLSSGDFDVRARAQKQLLDIGPAARPALEKALQSSDAECRLRAEEILRDLRSTDLWATSTITLKKSNAPAAEVFKEIERQSGNPIDWRASKGLVGKQISVDWSGKLYWQALDEACRLSQLDQRIEDGKSHRGVVLVPAERGPLATAYDGPVRIRVTYTSRQSFGGFRGRRDWGERGGESLDLNYELHWEPRVVLCRYLTRMRVLEALTDTKEALTFRNFGPAASPMHVKLDQREISYRTSLRQFRADGTTKLSTLRVETTLTAAGDLARLDVRAKPGASAREAGYLLEFLESKPAEKNAVEWIFQWTRPTPSDAINATDLSDEHFVVRSAADAEVPFGVRQQIGDRGSVRYNVILRNPGSADKVSFRFARLKSARRFEFKFTDVPIASVD